MQTQTLTLQCVNEKGVPSSNGRAFRSKTLSWRAHCPLPPLYPPPAQSSTACAGRCTGTEQGQAGLLQNLDNKRSPGAGVLTSRGREEPGGGRGTRKPQRWVLLLGQGGPWGAVPAGRDSSLLSCTCAPFSALACLPGQSRRPPGSNAGRPASGQLMHSGRVQSWSLLMAKGPYSVSAGVFAGGLPCRPPTSQLYSVTGRGQNRITARVSPVPAHQSI